MNSYLVKTLFEDAGGVAQWLEGWSSVPDALSSIPKNIWNGVVRTETQAQVEAGEFQVFRIIPDLNHSSSKF